MGKWGNGEMGPFAPFAPVAPVAPVARSDCLGGMSRGTMGTTETRRRAMMALLRSNLQFCLFCPLAYPVYGWRVAIRLHLFAFV